MSTNNNYLVIAAHPDDEVLGCGATIKKLTDQGHDVSIAILGEGVTSRYQERDNAQQDELEQLHATAQQVADYLGANKLYMLNLPDNRFDSVDLLDIVKKVETVIQEVAPNIIFTHHGGDLNIDHAITHRAVLTATRPTYLNYPVKEIYSFEVPSSTEWAFQQLQPVFRPNVFIDVEQTIDAKVKAMSFYEQEARPFPHPRSEKALKALAHYRGSAVGLQAAEAFDLIRSIR